MNKIQLIWDFRGPDAAQTAEHHAKHLQEYVDAKNYELRIADFEIVSDSFAVATLIVYEKDMIEFRDILKPQRAVYIDE